MNRFAISSWSLDGMLKEGTPLLDVPAQMAEHGIGTLEICHFHLPSTEPAYLQQLRTNLTDAGIELFSILIDTGDITAPDESRRAADVALIDHWISIAAALGAERVRIDAGLQPPTPAVIEQSAAQLRELARAAAKRDVRVSTENWHTTSLDPDALLRILDLCDDMVGLCADTGNAEATADKYQTVAQLLPRATSVHYKPRRAADGALDPDDLRRTTALISDAGFDGVITLIYDRKVNEWQGITQLRDALAAAL